MKLVEVINEVKSLQGYIYHRLRATDHEGMIKCYTFWFEKGGEIRDYEVRFLVIDEGQSTEDARCYGTSHITQPTPFKDEVNSKLAAFQTTHPTYENLYVESCNEDREIAIIAGYKALDGNAEAVKVVVYKNAGNLIFKLLPI